MKFFRTLLMLWLIPFCVSAQNKTQVLADFRWTLAEFQSALNFIVEEPDFIQQNIRNIADAFGSDEYFFYNSNKQPSFHEWLHGYYRTWQPDKAVVHTFNIREQSLAKMEPDRSEDHRWRFDADLSRTVGDGPEQKMLLSFIVQWGGEGHYAPILQIDGDLFFKHKPAPVITTDGLPASVASSFDFVGKYYSDTELILIRQNGKYGFVKKNGQVVAKPVYENVECCDVYGNGNGDKVYWYINDQLMSVKKNGRWGYIDRSGREVIPFAYESVQRYVYNDDTFVWVKKNGKFGCIDFQNNTVIPFIYDYKLEFNGQYSYAPAKKGKKWGYIDRSGNTVIPFNYEFTDKFFNGRAAVELNDRIGFIDRTGDMVIPNIYSGWVSSWDGNYEVIFHDFHFNYAAVKKNSKWGVIDRDGKTVIPFKFDDMNMMSSHTFDATIDNEVHYYDFYGNEYPDEKTRYAQIDSVKGMHGDVYGMLMMGERHYKKKNYRLAIQWLTQANDNGNDWAPLYLGLSYYYLKDEKDHYYKAADYFKTALTKGKNIEKAYDYLGWMAEYGQGMKKDIPTAIDWYRKSGYKDALHRADSLYNLYSHGHEYVDLGLSVKWATCNVGASKPEEPGDEFQWGETEPGNIGNKKSSRTYKEKYPSSIKGFFLYDAARDKMGGKWRMPTPFEIVELKEKCKWEKTVVGDYQCFKITGPNGNSILLPYGTSYYLFDYWTGSAENKKEARTLEFWSQFYYISTKEKYLGAHIRAVIE